MEPRWAGGSVGPTVRQRSHADIHAARGEWPVKPPLPFIPGHEGVGIVERIGPGNAHGIVEGMRVALPWLGYACGDCAYCNTGWETLCESQQNMGYSMNGGFAEYAVGYARHVVAVPDGIDPLDAAPLTCAGVTTYKAVKISGARSSDLVAVFGAGGLGHLAISTPPSREPRSSRSTSTPSDSMRPARSARSTSCTPARRTRSPRSSVSGVPARRSRRR